MPDDPQDPIDRPSVSEEGEMVENDYPTDDDEQLAHTATYANQAHAVIWRHVCDSGVLDAAFNDPWADKVEALLGETMRQLEVMAHEECRFRPGMLEVGRAYGIAWAKEHEGELAEIEAAFPHEHS